MATLLRIARFVFAFDLALFALQYLCLPHWAAGLPPVPPGQPGTALAVRGVGLLLLLLSAGLLTRRTVLPSSVLIGVLFTASALVLHGQRGAALLHDGSVRTGLFETLAIGGAAFALASTATRGKSHTFVLAGWFGVVLFAVSMLVFGEQHFEFARFVALLIPAWLPAHLFWTYFTGVAMIAAAVAYFIPRIAATVGSLLGLMFLLWVLLLHLPRCLAHSHDLPEWTSAGVALTMAAGAWIVTACVGGLRTR